jgi:2-dehydropantoate 2-reductase
VKSNDSKETIRDLSQNTNIFSDKTRLILCQNGWGNAEIFLEKFQKNKIFYARIITGFSRPNANEVEKTVHVFAVHMGNLWGHNYSSLLV